MINLAVNQFASYSEETLCETLLCPLFHEWSTETFSIHICGQEFDCFHSFITAGFWNSLTRGFWNSFLRCSQTESIMEKYSSSSRVIFKTVFKNFILEHPLGSSLCKLCRLNYGTHFHLKL